MTLIKINKSVKMILYPNLGPLWCNKYDINLRFQNQIPTANEIQELDQALAKIQKLRPDDFANLNILSLIIDDSRKGGYTQHFIESPDEPGLLLEAENGNLHRIEIEGPFAPIEPTGYVDEPYTLESAQSYAQDGTIDFLFKFISHELAHTLSSSHEEFYSELFADYDLKKNSFTAQMLDGGMVASELFAEDYMTYLASHGQRVSSRMASGQSIPFYEDRLAYFHENFPLE